MKYSKCELIQSENSTIFFDELITFEPETFAKLNSLRGLHDVTVSGNVHYDSTSDLVYADLEVEGVMIVPCSITLEDVEYDFHTKSLEVFSFDKSNKDEDVHIAKGDVVELLPVVFQLIILEIPLKVVKPGLNDYPKGNGWEVVKEEDYIKEKSDDIDPRLAKLKEFKIEND
ncbi:MAG: YceD family protein [Erysipelotrichaceae bacterium]